jgi:hypothetical protein
VGPFPFSAGAVYDRASFLESTKYAVIDRAYRKRSEAVSICCKSADQDQRVVVGTGLRVEHMLGNCDRGLAQHIEGAFEVGPRFQAIGKD